MAPRMGIVAGGGELPPLLVAACRATGREPFVLALEGNASADVFDEPPDAWIAIDKVGRGLDVLRSQDVNEIVIAGSVKRPSLLSLRPDAWTAKLLARSGTAILRDNGAISVLVQAIEDEGFRVIAPERVLEGLLARSGSYGSHEPDESAWADIRRGFRVAKEIGRLDLGQAVVVQQGVVLGVEAAEGTDGLIARCAELCLEGPGGVLVKVSKPGQERRVDLPTIGRVTLEAASRSGLRGVAVEAGSALIIDANDVARIADELELFVVAVEASDPSVADGQ